VKVKLFRALTGERILQAFSGRNITPVLAEVAGVLVIALIAETPFFGASFGCWSGSSDWATSS